MAGCQMCSGENSVPTWPFHCFDKSILTIDRSPELTAVSPRPSVKNTPDGSILESRAPTTPVALRPVSASHAPAVVSAPGVQFRKNLWRFRNQRPKLGFWGCQQSFRNWTPGADSQAGGWGRDEIRNITGDIGFTHAGSRNGTGALKPSGGTQVFSHWDGSYLGSNTSLGFDASLSVPTGPQNVPQHIWQPAVLYLGRPA